MMRKLFLLFCLLCLPLFPAQADEINWVELEPFAADAGLTGRFHILEDVGLKLWLPDAYSRMELTQEVIENEFIAYFSTADNASAVGVTCTMADVPDLESYAGMLPELKAQDLSLDTINGMDAVSCIIPDSESYNVAFMPVPGQLLEFVLTPVSDDSSAYTASLIAASIQSE